MLSKLSGISSLKSSKIHISEEISLYMLIEEWKSFKICRVSEIQVKQIRVCCYLRKPFTEEVKIFSYQDWKLHKKVSC